MTPKKLLLTVMLAVALPAAVSAQCRSFAKNKCIPALAPFKFNETFNAAQLALGEEAEVELTFYSGQEYRVLVCSHPILGDVNWHLIDAGGNILFTSAAGEGPDTYDFKVATTQKLTVKVEVPPGRKGGTNLHTTGCIGILVGFRE